MRRRGLFVAALAVLSTLAAASVPTRGPAGAGEKQTAKPLRVALFPYVPDAGQIRKEIKVRWDKLKTGVELEFYKVNDKHGGRDWDPYSEDPPDDLDVFELDAVSLDYFVRGNWVSAITDADVGDPEDILDFAWKGCMAGGRLFGVPRLACTYVLFYRDGDKEVESAKSLDDLFKAIGATSDSLERPEANKGMLINLHSGTDCACLYLDAVMDSTRAYSASPALPAANALGKDGLGSLSLLGKMAGRNLGLHKDSTAEPDRPRWFADGLGRVMVGYSERLYFMPKAVHGRVRARALPLGPTNAVNLYFVDLLAVNPLVRGERRKLALKFINLCTSAETVKACLMPSAEEKPSQYLLPVRRSVIEDEGLANAAPVYKDLRAVLLDGPAAFRMGPDGRGWLSSEKKLIQARLFAFP